MKHELRKERLEEIAAWRERFTSGYWTCPADDAEAMARALLAGMEQEPAGYLYRTNTPLTVTPWRYAETLPDYVAGEGWEIRPQYDHPAPSMPADLHPDTQKLVADFSTALAEKLYKAQLRYGYSNGWKNGGWCSKCMTEMMQHIEKGDPRDVAAYCAFMWFHQWKTWIPAPSTPAAVPDLSGVISELEKVHDWILNTLPVPTNSAVPNARRVRDVLAACRAAMLQSEPVSQPYKLPDGYCVMPRKLSAENGAKGALSGEFHITHRIGCQSCGGEGCEDCNEEGGWDGEILIGWDIIKRIHEAAVEACALPAAPKGV